MGRVTNFRNWVPELCANSQTTILALEYWCHEEDETWNEANDRLVQRAAEEIRVTGLIGKTPITDAHVIRLSCCYPVYTCGYMQHLRSVADFLATIRGLTPIGRSGTFKYNNQDHSILMGILAAANILDNEHHDLWAVNTDYDTYQESAIITSDGLLPA